jgi:diacylglycerol kinase (ATP)
MGLIPLGTGNVLAREIALPRRAGAVVEALLNGRVETVHGARASGQPFYLMAGIGFDGRTVAALEQRFKRRLGRAAYGHAMLRSLNAPLDEISVEIDGRPYAANWVIVTNARHYGGSFILAPRASIFTPGLEAILVRASSRLGLLAQLLRLTRGRLTADDNRHVTVLPARTVLVTSLQPVPVQLDGDCFGVTPLTIDADGPHLRLIVPA